MQVFAYQPEQIEPRIPDGVRILRRLEELLPALGQAVT